ncbi:MAG: hypothetical protein HY063_11860 [Bacteroidetes bacterium]|nr:hypothetical protein [Bacteroidota bacterium]
MARQKGVIKVKGTLDEVTFYERGGKSLAKKRTSLSKSKIKNAKEFARTRENMSEFGGSALVGKALRVALSMVLAIFADTLLVSRLVKVMRAISEKGTGVRGKRSFLIMPNKNLLKGFELNVKKVLETMIWTPYTLAVNAGRNMVTMTVPDFDTGAFIHAPSGATHFRLLCSIGTLSDHTFNISTGKYEPTDPTLTQLGASASSVEIVLGGMVGSTTTLAPQLTGAPALTATVGLVVCVGIEFLQFTNGSYYLLSKQNAMRIVDVM